MIVWCLVCRRNIEMPGEGYCRPCLVEAGEPVPNQPSPYYQRGPVTLYHGRAELVTPYLHEPGICIWDPPYSKHTHEKSRAGARTESLYVPRAHGRRRMQISHAVDFGFEPLRGWERRAMAAEARRLSSRWSLVFSDAESAWLWRISLMAQGLEYVRTMQWIKLCGSPQFTGDRPAVAAEAITLVHPPGAKRWNGGGKRGIYEHAVVLNRSGGNEVRENETQKPLDLMLELVEDFTEPGELVYDFTCGFATTAIACLRAKGGPRRFVGIEMRPRSDLPEDPDQIGKAARRVDAELSLSTYQAARAGQLPMFGSAT